MPRRYMVIGDDDSRLVDGSEGCRKFNRLLSSVCTRILHQSVINISFFYERGTKSTWSWDPRGPQQLYSYIDILILVMKSIGGGVPTGGRAKILPQLDKALSRALTLWGEEPRASISLDRQILEIRSPTNIWTAIPHKHKSPTLYITGIIPNTIRHRRKSSILKICICLCLYGDQENTTQYIWWTLVSCLHAMSKNG